MDVFGTWGDQVSVSIYRYLDERSDFFCSRKGPPQVPSNPIALPPVTPTYEVSSHGNHRTPPGDEHYDHQFFEQRMGDLAQEAGPSAGLATAKPKTIENDLQSEVSLFFYPPGNYALS